MAEASVSVISTAHQLHFTYANDVSSLKKEPCGIIDFALKVVKFVILLGLDLTCE